VARLKVVPPVFGKVNMEKESLYHIYNQGNNRDHIFYLEKNYIYFLKKVRKHLLPHLELLAYCLMPNHFHFLAYTKPDFNHEKYLNDLRIMLSSYTRAINKQESRTGSLFRQNTKTKNISHSSNEQAYGLYCYLYIHQNPLRAMLVERSEDWLYSSYRDYTGMRNGTLCNIKFAVDMLNLPTNAEELIELTDQSIPEHIKNKII